MRDADTIVIGGGHNGLILAALLAEAGQRVLLLERAAQPGGRARARSLEGGFLQPGLLHDTQHFNPRVVEALQLTRRGLRRADAPPPWFLPTSEGGLRVAGEVQGVSASEAEAYQRFVAFQETLRPLFEPLLQSVPPNPGAGLMHLAQAGWSNRGLLGRKDLLEILRLLPMCAADWLGEWFESQPLQAGLAMPAVTGEFTGPWSPGTNALLVLQGCTRGGAIEGGPSGLIEALLQACEASGVEVLCGQPVSRILVEDGTVCGVEVADGASYRAERVVASCNPQHALLDLLERGALGPDAVRRVRQIRQRGTTAKLHLGVSGEVNAGAFGRQEWWRVADSLDDVERAFDPIKYDTYAEQPVLDVWIPTVSMPDLGPAGHDLLSILVHYAPRDLEGGWSDAARKGLEQAVLQRLERFIPDLSDRIVSRELLTPLDLEEGWQLPGGHLDHGERGLDQLLVRPTLECARYATPVKGLFLASSGCFPGGGLTGTPGLLASERILGEA